MRLLIVFFLCLISVFVRAQVLSDELIELKPPSIPALTIMGQQSMEISRPKSLNQLEASLLSSFGTGANGTFPNDFGLEVMPYWLKRRTNKVFNRASLEKSEFAPLENLAISLATVSQQLDDASTKTQIGFGVRTLLFSGKVAEDDLVLFERLNTEAARQLIESTSLLAATAGASGSGATTYGALLEALRSEYRNIQVASGPEADTSTTALSTLFYTVVASADLDLAMGSQESERVIGEMQQILDNSLNATEFTNLANKIRDARIRKSGFSWEIAAASYLDFPTGEIEYSIVPKAAGWTTIGYRMPKINLDISGLARYIRDFELEENTQNFDFGLALAYNPGKFNLAGELVQRFQQSTIIRTLAEDGVDFEKDDVRQDYRLALNVSYRLQDTMIISYSFGKTFDFSDGLDENVLSMLSLHFGFGKVPLLGSN